MASERTKERFGLVEEREIKGRKEKIGETDRESERDERERKREKKKERYLRERGERQRRVGRHFKRKIYLGRDCRWLHFWAQQAGENVRIERKKESGREKERKKQKEILDR